MTPSARATALLVAVAVAVLAAATAATFLGVLAWLERRDDHPAATLPRHVKPPTRHRHRRRPVSGREWRAWTVSLLVRWFRHDDGAPKSAVVLASLFLAFSALIGASQ